MIAILRFYLSPKGRLSRRDYWLLVFLPFFVIAYLNEVQADLFGTPNLSTWLQVITLWPVLVVLSRRFHDLNLSGWWALLYFVPPIAIGAAERMHLIEYGTWIKVTGLVALGLVPGSVGENSFGPPSCSLAQPARKTEQ